jgi:hypothetical protein
MSARIVGSGFFYQNPKMLGALPDSDLGSLQGPAREIEDLDNIHPIN